MTRLARLAVIAVTLLGARVAAAHAVGLSLGEYRTLGDGVEAMLVFDRAELGALLACAPDVARAQIERRIVQRVHVRDASGQACAGSLSELVPSEERGVRITAVYRCAAPPGSVPVELAFWDALSPGHRHLAVALGAVTSGTEAASGTEQPLEQVLHERWPRLALAALPPAEAPSLAGWLRLGIEHILEGYDHLLFLLALVIVMPVARTLAATVSLFTLAHSITLALAALGVVTPPSSWVECAIALSIVYVGLENLTPRAVRPRFAIVFAFGLVHGFGFAGALAELGRPAAQTPGALLSFNAGVELGQLAVLAVAFPLVQQLRRAHWFEPHAVPALSLVTALAGGVWFFERV